MSQKLDKFKGKITPKSSPKVISGVLSDLEKYLLKYEEKDAASIVKTLAKQPSSHRDKINQQKSVKQYEQRTEVLRDINKTLKKIREDMIDEQDTSIKKKPGLFTRAKGGIARTKRAIGKTVNAAKKPFNMFSNLLKNLLDFKSWIPKLIGGLISMVTSVLLAPFRWIGSIAALFASLMLKLAGKIVKFIGKGILKLAGWLAKQAWKALKWLGRGLASIGKKIAGFAIKGLKKLGGLLSDLARGIKDKFSSGKNSKKKIGKSSNAGEKSANSNKSKTGSTKSSSTKPKAKTPKGGFVDKAKEALDAVKKKIIPKLEKIGLKGVTKVLGTALAKLASRAVPFLGWGLLAYDAFNAAKKSNSLLGFGVNLLDETVSGALSAVLGNTNGMSAGDYIDGIINDEIKPTQETIQNDKNASNNVDSKVDSPEVKQTEKDSESLAEFNKYMLADNELGTIRVTSNGESAVEPEFRSFENLPIFSKIYDAYERGELSKEQALELLNRYTNLTQVQVSKNTNINNDTTIHSEELLHVKNLAVAEATQIAAAMSKQVLATTSNAMVQVHDYTSSQIIVNQGSSLNQVKHFNSKLTGSVQG